MKRKMSAGQRRKNSIEWVTKIRTERSIYKNIKNKGRVKNADETWVSVRALYELQWNEIWEICGNIKGKGHSF